MVGHFLQPNRRNRSLSQPTDGTNTSGTVDSISGSSIGSGGNTGNVIPVIASHVTHKNNATIDVNSNFGYNVDNVTISKVNDNSNNTNGTSNHHHHRHPQHSAMASTSQYPVTTHQAAAIAPPTMYDISSSSMQYMPPQNLTAEAVAALPPPGPFI
jgi:vesicle coat complex subunit